VYRESDLHDAVSQAVLDWVGANVPRTAGPNLDMSSIEYAPPAVQAVDQGRVVYATSATARVTYSLTPDLARQIRDLVKGKDVKQARGLITERYGTYLNPQSVQARVLWFNIDKLPSDPARIDVEPSGGPTGYTPTIAPTQTAPDPRSTEP
jgi:hypothetical protein